MKRRKTIKAISSKAIAMLLSISMIAGMSFTVTETKVSAAAIETNEPLSDVTPATSTELTQSTQSAGNTESLGLSGNQPERLDASGKPIDKNNDTPLGAKAVNFYQTLQLAAAGVSVNQSSKNTNDLYDIYNNPIDTNKPITTDKQAIDTSSPLLGADTLKSNPDWSRLPKDMTGADINGTGKDVLVVAAANPQSSNGKLDLVIAVIDYNSGKPIQKTVTIQSGVRIPSNITDASQGPVHITAGDYNHDGKDEIAVALDTCLFVYSISETSGSISVKSLSVADVNGIIGYQYHYYDSRVPRIDIESADSDEDGYKELLVTAGLPNSEDSSNTMLLIYHGTTDVNKPTAKIPLAANGIMYNSASVAVGDVFGTGQNEIVIAGAMKDGTDKLTTINYNPESGTYDASLINTLYDLGVPGNNRTGANHVYSDLEYLNCVSLKAPVPGQPQDVVYGDCIYQFDSTANSAKGGFVKQDVSNGRSGNISGVRYTNKDNTYILKTLVGNFDGNTNGKQQIIMMHYNNFQNGDHGVLITVCCETTAGTINIDGGKLTGLDNYPAICAPDVFLNGARLVYDKAEFTFSDPTIIAVLGATPYYKEIPNDSYPALGNCGTTYGTENSTEHESENGVTLHAGVTLGLSETESALFASVSTQEFEIKVETSFSNKWSESKSFSTSVGYTGYYNQDTVVLSVIPYDIYYYKLYNSEHPEGTEISINVPYAPQTTTLSVDYYNSVAKGIANAPIISSNVLRHTVGDPRTYPSGTNGLSNIPNDRVLVGGDNRGNQFVSSGMGNSSTEESITSETSSGVASEWSLDTDISISVTSFGAKAGVNFGMGYVGSETITSTSSTTRSGSVAAVPSGYGKYQFQWSLVAYDYNIGTNGRHQEFPVISYLVKHSGTIPPAQPDNLVAKTNSLGSALLQWSKITPCTVSPATGYVISRSDDGGTTYADIGTTTSIQTGSYADSGLQDGKTYYYKVAAYYLNPTTSAGIPTDPAPVTALSVNSISISAQPDKLVYDNGDRLDLSSLAVTLNCSNGTSLKAEAPDFADLRLSVSLANLPVNLGSLPNVDVDTVDLRNSSGGTKKTPGGTADLPASTGNVPGVTGNVPVSPGNVPVSPGNVPGGAGNVPVRLTTNFVLSATESGAPITVTYTPGGLTASTNPLTIKTDTSAALTVQLRFNVGGQNDATKLLPNRQLYVTANIANNQDTPQNLILMVALYDANGAMVNYSVAPGNIHALSAAQIDTSDSQFTLPANVSGYTAKAFILDGTDIKSSLLIPLCYPVQITG